MQIKNTTERYGAVAQALHWLMALAMIGMVALGFYMASLDPKVDTFKYGLYGIHKSLGITILILAALRLSWRFVNVQPPLPQDMGAAQKTGAKGAHWALYALMFAMPLGGWVMSSAGGHPVSLWGLELPAIVDKNKELGGLAKALHFWGGWALVVVISLHFAAALYHHFVRKDDVLKRMWPF